MTDTDGNEYKSVLQNVQISPPSLGTAYRINGRQIKFVAGNLAGTGTISYTDELNNLHVIPVKVFSNFNLEFNISGADQYYAELWDIDRDTFMKTPVASSWGNNDRITFNSVSVDTFEVVLKSKTRFFQIIDNQSSFYTQTFPSLINCAYEIDEQNLAVDDLSGRSVNSTIANLDIVRSTAKTFHDNFPSVGQSSVQLTNETVYSNQGVGYIKVKAVSPDNDHKDPDVILHEYGHFYIHVKTGIFPQSQYGHSWWTSSNNSTAFVEGFATFFSCLVRNSPIYKDKDGSKDPWINIDSDYPTPTTPNGNMFEGSVGAALWDLFDYVNEPPHDNLSGLKPQIMDVSDETIPHDIDQYVNIWNTKGYPYAYSIFNNHGIYYPSPPSAPTGFNVSGSTGDYPILLWDENTENDIDRYNIYEDTGSGMHFLVSVNHPTTGYVYTGMRIGHPRLDPQFCFEVRAVNTSGLVSQPSNDDCVGASQVNKDQSEDDKIPTHFELAECYPNPFNPSTTISYQIAADGFVNLTVYNSLGEVVKVLINEFQPKAGYSVEFDASNLPSGIYFYKLQSNNFSSVKKMILAK